jgi:hypothetical protein
VGLMDDLVGALHSPTILGRAPTLGADAKSFHRQLRDVVTKDPDRAAEIGPRIEAIYRGLWPGAPAAVARDCALAHLRLACTRRDLGPLPSATSSANGQPLERAARRRTLMARVKPVVDEARAEAAKRAAAKAERDRQWALDALHMPDPRLVSRG